jgi:hypothetical protein
MKIEENSDGIQQLLNGEGPELMTEEELVHFLRIPNVSKSADYSNVVKNLIRMRSLPRIQMCNRILFPKKEVLEWISQEIIRN